MGCQASVKDVLHDVSQIKANLVVSNGEEQIVRTKLQGEAQTAFAAIGTTAPPRVLEK